MLNSGLSPVLLGILSKDDSTKRMPSLSTFVVNASKAINITGKTFLRNILSKIATSEIFQYFIKLDFFWQWHHIFKAKIQ